MKLLIKSMLAVAAMLLTFNLSVAEAASGPAGPKGATGATGPMGPKGNPGFPGLLGPKGANGTAGSVGAHAVNGTVIGQILVWDGTAWKPTIPVGCPQIVNTLGPDGGTVVWVDSTGCHGLEAMPSNLVGLSTDAQGLNFTDAVSAAALTNQTSSAITGSTGYNCSQSNAQGSPECWHLPTQAEFALLHPALATYLPGLATGWYWSDTACAPNRIHVTLDDFSAAGCDPTAPGNANRRAFAVRTF